MLFNTAKNCVMAAVTASLLLLICAAAGEAESKIYDLHATGSPQIVDKLVVAPGSIFFIGIDPLQYPRWTMSVDDKLVAGPAPNLPSIFSGSAISPADATFNPLPSPSSTPSIAGLPDLPTPGPTTAPADEPCVWPSPAKPTLVDAQQCSVYVDDGLRRIRNLIAEREDQYRAARLFVIDLAQMANRIVTASEKQIGDLASYKQFLVDIDEKYGYGNERRKVLEHIARLQPWPADDYYRILADAKALQTFYTQRNNTDTSQEHDANTKISQLKPAIDALEGQKSAKEVAALKKLQAQNLTEQESAKVAQTDITTNVNPGLNRANWFLSRLQDPDPQGTVAKSYNADLAYIRQVAIFNILPATEDRFAYYDTEQCRGLDAGSRQKTFTLNLGNGNGAQVRVVCASKMFLSAGVAFSGLSQATYTTVPLEGTVPPAASPSPAPVRIVASALSRIQASGIILNNVKIAGAGDSDSGPYASFGAAIANGNSGGINLSYVGGVSWVFSRAMVITGGIQYGQQTELPDGYHVGDVLPAGSNAPPAVTRNGTKLFFGVTFGSGGAQ